jgi:hypothetical protein
MTRQSKYQAGLVGYVIILTVFAGLLASALV